jgi:hypothetical protein
VVSTQSTTRYIKSIFFFFFFFTELVGRNSAGGWARVSVAWEEGEHCAG